MKWSVVAGAGVVSCGAAAIAVGGRGQWVADDPNHVWALSPVTPNERNWLLVAAIALAVCSLVGLVGLLRWLVVVAWAQAGAVVLFTMLDVQKKIGSSKPPTGARLGWGAWAALGGVVVAMLGLMVMMRRELDDAPVPEPKRARRKPAKKPAAKAPVKKAAASPVKKAAARPATKPTTSRR